MASHRLHWDAKAPITRTLARIFALAGMYPVALISPLVYRAVARNDGAETLRLLDKCPAALLPLHEDQVSPFAMAVINEHGVAASALARRFPHLLTDRDSSGRTPLLQAAVGVDFKPRHIDLLISLGADPLSRDDSGRTALHWSLSHSMEMTNTMLQNGVPVNAANNDGITPLMTAAMRSRSDAVEKLLAFGADIHAADASGKTAVAHAIGAGALGTAAFLIDRGAKVNLDDPALERALRVATEEMETDFLKAIGRLQSEAADKARIALEGEVSAMSAGTENDVVVRPLRLLPRKASTP